MSKVSKAAPRAKPLRYRAGKAPAYAGDYQSSSESDDDQDIQSSSIQRSSDAGKQEAVKEEISEISAAPNVQSDRRLQRLQQSRSERTFEGEGRAERPGRGREGSGAGISGITIKEAKAESEEEDENAAVERRQRLREQALRRQKEEEEAMEPDEEEEEEDEYTSEYTDDSDDDIVSSRTLLKPLFVSKNHRETILERERQAKEEEEAEKRRLEQLEERKKESHNMVAEELRKELVAVQEENGPTDIDDRDGLDEDAEYAAWKLRELKRIKRDREERETREREAADIERRRKMTDAEIQAENARDKDANDATDKGQMRFLQKYYHKGVFYTDDDQVSAALKKDFTAPTLDDQFDKSSLPAVMQVKNFGRAGQTKYTHLADQDTTQKDAAWAQFSEVNKRTVSKMGGMKQGFDKPTKRRKI